MEKTSSKCTVYLAGLILCLSAFAFYINYSTYHFQGNSFFPNDAFKVTVILIVFNIGLQISFKKGSYPRLMGIELLYFLGVMSVIAIASNAVQLTPFPTIDTQISTMEARFGINMEAVVIWTNSHLNFQKLLNYIYDSLPYQMSFLPLLVIASGQFQRIRNYYFLLLCTTLFGFVFYYFFPTTAPASILNSSLFTPEQIATGLKFNQIHNHIAPSTNAGGLIALPSFHVIWALLCIYLVKDWTVPFVVVTIINSMLIASCVLLGWHYPTDVLAGIALTLFSMLCMNWCETET